MHYLLSGNFLKYGYINRSFQVLFYVLLIFCSLSSSAFAAYESYLEAYQACSKVAPAPMGDPPDNPRDYSWVYSSTCSQGNDRLGAEKYGYIYNHQAIIVCSWTPGYYSLGRNDCGHFIYWIYGCPDGHPECPCKPPFQLIDGKCRKPCPPCRSELDLNLGQCVAKAGQANCQECTQGNPISLSTGEKIQTEAPDYQSYGPLPLLFQREYRSYRAEEADIFWQQASRGTPLKLSTYNLSQWVIYEQPEDYEPAPGVVVPSPWSEVDGSDSLQAPVAGHKQWRHNYQSRLVNTGTRLIIDTPKGYKVFRADGDNYVSLHLSRETLLPVVLDDGSHGWRYMVSPRYSETYHSDGQLLRISQSESIYQALAYNSEGQLESVTHSLGGSLQLAYNSAGQLSQLIPPDNQSLTYQYDERGNLVQVDFSYPEGQTRTRQYHYENQHLPFALTGITDENGIRYASWSYNEQGKAIESVHAGGVDKTTFDYQGDASTRVTSPLNKTTIYHYDNSQGMKRLSSVEGVATPHCAAANQAYQYDNKGLLQSKTDWQGNITTYGYNDKYQQIRRTEASGTPAARTITTQWHETLDLPVQITEPRRIINYRYDEQGKLLHKTLSPVNGPGE